MQVKTAVTNFCKGYFATCQRSEKTRIAYTFDLSQFVDFTRPRTQLQSIDSEMVERWADWLRTKGYAPASMKRKMASLRVFFLYWVRKRLLDSSPMWQLRLSFPRSADLPRCLSKKEMYKLLRVAYREANTEDIESVTHLGDAYRRLRNLALASLLFATGLRVGEAAALDVDDFRQDERLLFVHGKGGRRRLAFLTDASSYRIQIDYLSVRNRICTGSPALFLNPRGQRLSTQGISYALKAVAKTAGLDRPVTPHMFRHTVATLLLRNGADIRVVQEFLGHASISSTQRYTHVAKRHLLSTLKRFHPGRGLLESA